MEDKMLRKEILSLVKKYHQKKYPVEPFIPGKTEVRFAGRVFDEKELTNLVEASLDFWLTAGYHADSFEYELAEFLGVEDSILVNSGSSANLVAMSTLTSPKLKNRQLKPGDEVITVAAGFPTTVAPIIQNKLVPVFIDVDLKTYNAIPELIEQAISSKTKAIFMAHTLGNPFNLDIVMHFAKKYNLWVIEDNCDALGSLYKDKYTGTFGDLATISYYPAHHITMGEGGSVITKDENLARIARSFRDWGRDCYCGAGEDNTCGIRYTQQFGNLPQGYDHKYVYSHMGYNLKATDMQAAVGREQLKKLKDFGQKRRQNFKQLYDKLKKFDEYFIFPEATEHSNPSWFGLLMTLRENLNFKRNELTQFLNDNKIHTRNLFAGNILKQPAFMDIDYRLVGNLNNTDYIMDNSFFIGVYPGITEEHINYVESVVAEFISIKK